MVTATRLDGNNEIAKFGFDGKSSDPKPKDNWEGTKIRNGSYFFEMDTQTATFYDGEINDWI